MAAQKGDRTSLEMILGVLRAQIIKSLENKRVPEDWCEDIADEVLIVVLEYLPALRPHADSGSIYGGVRAFAATVTSRRLSDHRRRQARASRLAVNYESHYEILHGADETEHAEMVLVEMAIQTEQQAILREALRSTSALTSGLIKKILDGTCPRDAATALGITYTAARKRISRFMQVVRNKAGKPTKT